MCAKKLQVLQFYWMLSLSKSSLFVHLEEFSCEFSLVCSSVCRLGFAQVFQMIWSLWPCLTKAQKQRDPLYTGLLSVAFVQIWVQSFLFIDQLYHFTRLTLIQTANIHSHCLPEALIWQRCFFVFVGHANVIVTGNVSLYRCVTVH